MARTYGFWDRVFRHEWQAINHSADELNAVEDDVGSLKTLVERQSQALLRMQATVMGLVELLHDKVSIGDAELELAVEKAWQELTGRRTHSKPLDPYRGMPAPTQPAAMTTCMTCGREIPASETNVSLDGAVRCETCS